MWRSATAMTTSRRRRWTDKKTRPVEVWRGTYSARESGWLDARRTFNQLIMRQRRPRPTSSSIADLPARRTPAIYAADRHFGLPCSSSCALKSSKPSVTVGRRFVEEFIKRAFDLTVAEKDDGIFVASALQMRFPVGNA